MINGYTRNAHQEVMLLPCWSGLLDPTTVATYKKLRLACRLTTATQLLHTLGSELVGNYIDISEASTVTDRKHAGGERARYGMCLSSAPAVTKCMHDALLE